VKRATCEKGAIRSSGFEVPKTSNFGHRTLVRLLVSPILPVSLGYPAWCAPDVPDVQTMKFRRAQRVFPQPAGEAVALIVEVDVYAVTTAVSAFFAGLATGGGKHALDRRTKSQ